MGQSHSEVQESKTSGHQDIEDADESLQELIADLLDADLYAEGYTGPGAHTAEELEKITGMTRHTVTRWGEKMVAAGRWVKVGVPNPDRGTPGQPMTLIGWVKKETYEQWLGDNDDREQ